MSDAPAQLISEFCDNGYTVLPAAVPEAVVNDARRTVQNNLDRMGQTRAAAHSYHLAGFDRFTVFGDLHASLSRNERVGDFLTSLYGSAGFREIGLTDITVNRSQQWHSDLLRGPYSGFLADVNPWAKGTVPCVKALLYLQSGKSLRIIPGCHLSETPLDDAEIKKKVEGNDVTQLSLSAGDVVMMDIRSVHRGSTDEEMSRASLAIDPKILVSCVFGANGSRFADAMEKGNQVRMSDWDKRYLTRRT